MASSMNWVDGPAGGTPVSAANLNKLAVVADVATAGTPTGDALSVAYGPGGTEGNVSATTASGIAAGLALVFGA